jgi:hypothetical protein
MLVIILVSKHTFNITLICDQRRFYRRSCRLIYQTPFSSLKTCGRTDVYRKTDQLQIVSNAINVPVVLGGILVSVLAIGSKVRGFKLGRG